MNRNIGLFALLLCLVVSSAVQAEQFAPKAKITREMLREDHPAYLDAVLLQKQEIPSAEAVGVPPYPGAVVLFTQPATTMGMNGKDYEVLPRIVLAAPDAPEKVLAFYREKLPSWHHDVFYDSDHLWKGEGEYDPMTTALSMEHMMVQSPWGGMEDLAPESKSRIEIFYTP